MKIGILGGTFNPIHIAHIYLAKQYFAMLELDKLIFIPTYIPPHKPTLNLASAKQRIDMCRLAIADCPGFELCDYEITEQGKSYTYRTLKYLRGCYREADFFLIMGADMFLTVQDWRHPEEIYKMATLCAAERTDGEFSLMEIQADRLREKGARCIVLNMEPLPLSSTMIRKGIADGEDVSGLLNPGVWKYIRKNGLYG